MGNRDSSYRHFIPQISLSIERYTDRVPKDGKYYILKGDHCVTSFRSIKKAEEKFRQLVSESGYKPEPLPTEKRSASDEGIDRYLQAKDEYWAESYRYKGKTGKGGRGGI